MDDAANSPIPITNAAAAKVPSPVSPAINHSRLGGRYTSAGTTTGIIRMAVKAISLHPCLSLGAAAEVDATRTLAGALVEVESAREYPCWLDSRVIP